VAYQYGIVGKFNIQKLPKILQINFGVSIDTIYFHFIINLLFETSKLWLQVCKLNLKQKE